LVNHLIERFKPFRGFPRIQVLGRIHFCLEHVRGLRYFQNSVWAADGATRATASHSTA
jgi:hypothetical protein